MFPVDLLIQKVIELARERSENLSQLFERHVEPTYTLLREIHEHYIETITQAIHQIQAGDPERNVIEYLNAERSKAMTRRSHIHGVAIGMSASPYAERLTGFYQAVMLYLYGQKFRVLQDERAQWSQMVLRGLIQVLERTDPSILEQEREWHEDRAEIRKEIIDSFRWESAHLQELFARVSGEYGRLRARLLNP
jgi:hypothetical protein